MARQVQAGSGAPKEGDKKEGDKKQSSKTSSKGTADAKADKGGKGIGIGAKGAPGGTMAVEAMGLVSLVDFGKGPGNRPPCRKFSPKRPITWYPSRSCVVGRAAGG